MSTRINPQPAAAPQLELTDAAYWQRLTTTRAYADRLRRMNEHLASMIDYLDGRRPALTGEEWAVVRADTDALREEKAAYLEAGGTVD